MGKLERAGQAIHRYADRKAGGFETGEAWIKRKGEAKIIKEREAELKHQ